MAMSQGAPCSFRPQHPHRPPGSFRRLSRHVTVTCALAFPVPSPANAPSVAYGGWCGSCRGQHYLNPTPEALQAAAEVARALDEHGRIDYDVPAASANPLLSIDYVWTKGPGRMMGVLVAADKMGGKQVLKAFSGQMTNLWEVEGWAGPVASVVNSTPLYTNYRVLTESISARLAAIDSALAACSCVAASHQLPLDPIPSQPTPQPALSSTSGKQKRNSKQRKPQGKHHVGKQPAGPEASMEAFLHSQRRLLRSRRKQLSHELLHTIQRSYRVVDFRGVPLELLHVYDTYTRCRTDVRADNKRGGEQDQEPGREQQQQQGVQRQREEGGKKLAFPAGTGDCCAPKLLWEAARRGLQPLSLVEFWYGSPPNTATPQGRRNGAPAPGASRSHKCVYGMCDKCEAILGSMLCGAPAAGEGGRGWAAGELRAAAGWGATLA